MVVRQLTRSRCGEVEIVWRCGGSNRAPTRASNVSDPSEFAGAITTSICASVPPPAVKSSRSAGADPSAMASARSSRDLPALLRPTRTVTFGCRSTWTSSSPRNPKQRTDSTRMAAGSAMRGAVLGRHSNARVRIRTGLARALVSRASRGRRGAATRLARPIRGRAGSCGCSTRRCARVRWRGPMPRCPQWQPSARC